MTSRRLPTIVMVTVLGLLSAGCGDDTPEQETSAITTSVASTSTSTTTTTTSTTTTTTSTAPVEGDGCSAAGLTAPPTPPQLDPPAAETFRAVVDAAVACDFDALAVAAGDTITLSFGGHNDVAGFLRAAEFEHGDELLRIMVQLMTMEPGYQTDFATWVWPTFWEDDQPATADERASVEAIYGVPFDEILVDDLGYINHRVGIDADGDWLYFVAGD
jgi:hypothetical protein